MSEFRKYLETLVELQRSESNEDYNAARQIRSESQSTGTWPQAKEKKNSVFDRFTKKDSNGRSWLNKGLFEDGRQEGDVARTILATEIGRASCRERVSACV